MNQEPTDAPGEEQHEDPIALARAVMAGRSLKRGPLNQLLRQLVELIETKPVATPIVMTGPAPSIIANNLAAIPGALGTYMTIKAPIEVQAGPSGSVFLSASANRWYTNREACGLIGELIRKTASGGAK